MKTAVIVLPTYNEEGTIEKLITDIFKVAGNLNNWELHVAVVDSNSPDNTAQIVENLIKTYKRLHLIKTQKEGLGKAYVTGFQIVIEKLNPFVIFEMDADLSHNPDDIPEFLHKIEKGADFVIGSRYLKGGAIPHDWALHRKIFSIGANWVIRLGFMKLKNTEWTNGYRAIKTWLIKTCLPYVKNYSGYVFQVAFLDHALKSGARVEEIPIKFVDRKEGVSKINSIQYIVQTFGYTFTHSSFIKYVIVGFVGFAIDFGLSYLFIEKVRAAVWIATLISTESAIITNYLLNNYWSFAHKRISGGKFAHAFSFFKFNLVSSGSILIQTLGITLLSLLLGKQWWFIYKALIIGFVIIPYSYILYNKIIWKEK